jgi:hypothetical protein
MFLQIENYLMIHSFLWVYNDKKINKNLMEKWKKIQIQLSNAPKKWHDTMDIIFNEKGLTLNQLNLQKSTKNGMAK